MSTCALLLQVEESVSPPAGHLSLGQQNESRSVVTSGLLISPWSPSLLLCAGKRRDGTQPCSFLSSSSSLFVRLEHALSPAFPSLLLSHHALSPKLQIQLSALAHKLTAVAQPRVNVIVQASRVKWARNVSPCLCVHMSWHPEGHR